MNIRLVKQNQSKQTKKTVNSIANRHAAKPRDNSEIITESVKVSNSTVLLRYISSLAFFYWFV